MRSSKCERGIKFGRPKDARSSLARETFGSRDIRVSMSEGEGGLNCERSSADLFCSGQRARGGQITWFHPRIYVMLHWTTANPCAPAATANADHGPAAVDSGRLRGNLDMSNTSATDSDDRVQELRGRCGSRMGLLYNNR